LLPPAPALLAGRYSFFDLLCFTWMQVQSIGARVLPFCLSRFRVGDVEQVNQITGVLFFVSFPVLRLADELLPWFSLLLESA
jgi:hypothetical protein